VSRIAALVLAAVFTWSGVAKLVRRPDLTKLGLPAATWWVVSLVELLLAVTLLASPAWGGVAALALLAGFTAFLVARRGGDVGCGCFGSASTKPISNVDLARNAALLAVAAIAAFA
jgi:hypothetical protein